MFSGALPMRYTFMICQAFCHVCLMRYLQACLSLEMRTNADDPTEILTVPTFCSCINTSLYLHIIRYMKTDHLSLRLT